MGFGGLGVEGFRVCRGLGIWVLWVTGLCEEKQEHLPSP